MVELLGNTICCGAAVATIGLLFIGIVEIYGYLWNRVNKLRKGKK